MISGTYFILEVEEEEEEVDKNECHDMISFHIKDTLNTTVSNTSMAELLSLHKKM